MSINQQGWNFDNSYTNLPDYFFTKTSPLAVSQPKLIIVNQALAQELGLNLLAEDQCAEVFSGNSLPPGANPISQAYAGHQFGRFTMLGDGRAHLIGEHLTPEGKRVDIQLKGSGPTPYSRQGDGRAALEPMLREYIISEAMHALNIATTRSLAVVTTGEVVYRETSLPGAILTRIASSHIRVGSFEYLAAKKDIYGLTQLANYVIGRHYSSIKHSSTTPFLSLLEAVIAKQADIIVDWMRVGFIHGVMNTDNMAISGETIDYGPCAFMDNYDPDTVFSSIDASGRYRFINQPIIAQWNLVRFAETLLPLLHEDQTKAIRIAEDVLHTFADRYQSKWLAMMRHKLGLFGEQLNDEQLIMDLLNWMSQFSQDYTNTFCDLGKQVKPIGNAYDGKDFGNWYDQWQLRLKQNNQPLLASQQLMQANNPAVIPRNHKVNACLNAASRGDLNPLHNLLDVLREPYKNSIDLHDYQLPPSSQERVCATFCGT